MKQDLKAKQENTFQEVKEYIPSQIEMWKFYRKFIKIDWYILIGLNCQWLIESILHTRAPFLLLNIKDQLLHIEAHNYDSFFLLIIEFVATHIILQFFSFIQVKVTNRTSKMVQQNIQKQIVDHLFSLDIHYFEENKATSLHQIILQGSEQIGKEIQYGRIFQKINQFIYFASRAYFIYVQSVQIFISLAVVALICILLQQYFTKEKKKIEQLNNKICEFESFALDEILNNMMLIKTYCKEDKEKKNLEKIMQKNRDSRQQTLIYQQIISMIQSCSHEMMKIAVICHAFYYYLQHTTQNQENSNNQNSFQQQILSRNLGEIISNTYCILFLVRDFIQIINRSTDDFYENRKKHIGKVMNLFTVKSSISQEEIFNNQNNQPLEGEITFDNVSFSYPARDNKLTQDYKLIQSQSIIDQTQISNISIREEKQLNSQSSQSVLNQLSFKINPGECVGFVGVSGGGKSTIVKLIERYYDTTEGAILINGKNIKDVPLQALRQNIGLVHQEPQFFDNDIEYNVTYSLEGSYTQEQLNKVLEVSGVNEFILDKNRFPLGLKTLIGNKGVKLSTGQKQRIAIARALIIEPRILILDEATSALDAESESSFQKYIEQIKSYQNMTIIIITHRLSTVFNCDKIFVLQNGTIVEQGTHYNLLQTNSIYANLVKCQLKQNTQNQNPSLEHRDSVETNDSLF
ncbi:ABC transporter family protein (macronuclear) [Tetrahymena thermophila SB210]|uniref:ABC transporter family protein n=1 Tax=Tetrahymena thermophila (strain SB210) TaxID=312017 RepID=I7MFC6_TETTS|nr:ABC transporter family protein [Tetrahymena thermophila SB210]EAR83796.1 ABC transporter family protein [Tetrahymena thermophila SB210]|eukprot:XP_001031459.1 ABC transporter family protein [Tetrahymena thermophila SB210]